MVVPPSVLEMRKLKVPRYGHQCHMLDHVRFQPQDTTEGFTLLPLVIVPSTLSHARAQPHLLRQHRSLQCHVGLHRYSPYPTSFTED